MLREFIELNREDIVRRCRAKATKRPVPRGLAGETNHGVPLFLDQLITALGVDGRSNPEIARSAVAHGRDLMRQGFTASQVVHAYGDVCQAVADLAIESNAPISADDFRTLNRCLDEAIAGTVTEYGRGRTQTALDGAAASGNERLGFLAHELRNLTHTALMAFEVLKTGTVGITGNTGAVLHRSLIGTRTLIERSLDEVRLTQGVQRRESIQVADLFRELADAALLEARSRGISLTVMPVEEGVTVEADRQVLLAVLGNLLQNAFKFTRPQTTVQLRVEANAERVLIEVQDECGGLVGENINEELFRPFQQRSADRTGMGLGLAFSRWGTEANDGSLYARSLPHSGCVFTVDLPRHVVSAVVADQEQATILAAS